MSAFVPASPAGTNGAPQHTAIGPTPSEALAMQLQQGKQRSTREQKKQYGAPDRTRADTEMRPAPEPEAIAAAEAHMLIYCGQNEHAGEGGAGLNLATHATTSGELEEEAVSTTFFRDFPQCRPGTCTYQCNSQPVETRRDPLQTTKIAVQTTSPTQNNLEQLVMEMADQLVKEEKEERVQSRVA